MIRAAYSGEIDHPFRLLLVLFLAILIPPPALAQNMAMLQITYGDERDIPYSGGIYGRRPYLGFVVGSRVDHVVPAIWVVELPTQKKEGRLLFERLMPVPVGYHSGNVYSINRNAEFVGFARIDHTITINPAVLVGYLSGSDLRETIRYIPSTITMKDLNNSGIAVANKLPQHGKENEAFYGNIQAFEPHSLGKGFKVWSIAKDTNLIVGEKGRGNGAIIWPDATENPKLLEGLPGCPSIRAWVVSDNGRFIIGECHPEEEKTRHRFFRYDNTSETYDLLDCGVGWPLDVEAVFNNGFAVICGKVVRPGSTQLLRFAEWYYQVTGVEVPPWVMGVTAAFTDGRNYYFASSSRIGIWLLSAPAD